MFTKRIWGILGQGLAVLTITAALAGCGGSSDASPAASTAAASGTSAAAVGPSVSGTPPTTVAANNRYSFQPTVENPRGTPLSFGILNMPIWATFGETTGVLSGTPTNPDTGQYPNIVITANDGTTMTALPAFSIQVTAASRAAPQAAPRAAQAAPARRRRRSRRVGPWSRRTRSRSSIAHGPSGRSTAVRVPTPVPGPPPMVSATPEWGWNDWGGQALTAELNTPPWFESTAP